MRYALTDCEWFAIRPMLPNKPRGVPRVNPHRDTRPDKGQRRGRHISGGQCLTR